MTEPRNGAERLPPSEMDAERLAALLDGRLDERRRAEAVAQLASSDAEFEVFADALAITRELEAAEAADGVIPLRPAVRKPWWRRPGGHWAAIAAVLAGLALLPVLWDRSRGPDMGDPGGYAALLRGGGLPAGWDRSPWGTTRGPGDPLTEQARAVRLGARITDLEVAITARDVRVPELAAEIEALLDEVPAAGIAAAAFRQIRDHPGDSPDELLHELGEGREGILGLVDGAFLDLGAWAEAARIAVARRDADFFREDASSAALDRAARIPSLHTSVRSAVARIHSAAGADAEPNWGALERDLPELLRLAGS